ncbi:UNVERIFIED_CONTAM: hypothetical protein K2H54_067453 [Gekko kuhli]
MSWASSLVTGEDDGSGPYWYDIVQEGCGRTSPAEIEVRIEGLGARSRDDDEDDDPWSKRLNVLEHRQLYLQHHLEATLRSIPCPGSREGGGRPTARARKGGCCGSEFVQQFNGSACSAAEREDGGIQ